MFWKKTAKFSAIIIGILGIVDVLWRAINSWIIAGKASAGAKYYKEPITMYDGMIYGGVDAVFLSIIEFVLVLAIILLVISVVAMLVDIFNHTHNINEPTLLASIVDRPKRVPYNQYSQQPMNGMGNQPPMSIPQQPPMNMNNQPPMFQNNPVPQVQQQPMNQQQFYQQPVATIPNPNVNNSNSGEWVCECGQVNPAEAAFCSNCYILKK